MRSDRRKEFILVDQFQPAVSIVPRTKIDRGFQQIAVLIGSIEFLVLAAPHQCRCPVSCRKGTVIGKRCGLPLFVAGLESFGMQKATVTVLRCPISSRSDAAAQRPRIQRPRLYAPAFFIGLTAVER